ncbi:hypothetical protein GCM10009037_20070 [Halarchaeum grantii]|uniref:Uncharacterized protein n=1 Tax=Halarchaeum grantii TaxID=1193105 RepID=A0A830F3S2_9EURY|nr:hypothetical protein [Halarchaeum grantii]GGL36518.1 hypothetical protein GCM10009037_20070 [Halarchaeum grantii]
MTDHEEYADHSIWMTTLVEATGSRLPFSTPLSALLTIGLIPYLLTALFFILADGSHSLQVLVMQTLVATIAAIGPVLIWHYDEHIFPTFITEVADVVVDDDALITTTNEYERFFATRYGYLIVPWLLLIESVVIANIDFFQSIGVSGLLDPALLVYLIFAAWWSIITGIGLHGALTTILCVRAVGTLELTIDPLHHDGLGGLSTIGYFSIRATLLVSIGSLALPFAFALAARGGYQSLVYVAVVAYIGVIVLSFVYPTLYVNRRAQEVRDRILQEKREKIQTLRNQSAVESAGGELSELETQLKIRTLRDDFHEYQSVSLYPLSVSILIRLASSVLLPIAFTLLDTYVLTK